MLREPAVRTLLQQYTNNLIQEKKDELEPKILKTLWARAFWDPAEYFDCEGQPKFTDWSQIPPDARLAIEALEKRYWGKDADASTVEIKMADRHKALSMLAQYVGMLKGLMPGTNGEPGQQIGLTPEALVSLQSLYASAAPKAKRANNTETGAG